LPVLASSAAIPTQVVTLTLNPMWSVALFAAALVLTCGVLWLVKNVEQGSRTAIRDRASRTIAFPRASRPAVAGAGHRGA
jgi:hypothetical protein